MPRKKKDVASGEVCQSTTRGKRNKGNEKETKTTRGRRNAKKIPSADGIVDAVDETAHKSSPYFTASQESYIENVSTTAGKKRTAKSGDDSSVSSKIKKLKESMNPEDDSESEFEEVTAKFRSPDSKNKSLIAGKSKKKSSKPSDGQVRNAENTNTEEVAAKYMSLEIGKKSLASGKAKNELGKAVDSQFRTAENTDCKTVKQKQDVSRDVRQSDVEKFSSRRGKGSNKQRKVTGISAITEKPENDNAAKVSIDGADKRDSAGDIKLKDRKHRKRKQIASKGSSEEINNNKKSRIIEGADSIQTNAERDSHVIKDEKLDESEESDEELMEELAELGPATAETTQKHFQNPSVPETLDHNDAMALLLHMEGPKPSMLGVQPSTSCGATDDVDAMSDDDDDGDDVDSEEEEWEDVEDLQGLSPKKSQLPSGPVEITLEAPVLHKKRKKGEFDLQTYFRRQINKFKREVAMDIHKVHLLCLLARCQYLNSLCQDETFRAQALSITLVTKELKLPPSKSRTESDVSRVLNWIQSEKQYLSEVMEESLRDVHGQLRLTLICVLLLRQVGFLTRLMTALQPVPFKETSSKITSKKGKALKSSATSKTKKSVKTEVETETDSKTKKNVKSAVKTETDTKTCIRKDSSKSSSSRKRTPESKTSKAKSGKNKSDSLENEGSDKSKTGDIKKEIVDSCAFLDNKTKVKAEKSKKSTLKRRSSERKCSKVSRDVYKETNSSEEEVLSDDADEEYKPDSEEVDGEKNIGKKGKSKANRSVKKEITDSSDAENTSDSDFEEESILLRTQQLKRQTSGTRNKRILSTDVEDIEAGVDHWAEVYLQKEQKWVCVDCVSVEVKKPYEIENQATQPISYVVGITQDGHMRDVTARYANQWLTETRKLRVDSEWWTETLEPYRCPDKKLEEQEDMDLNSHLQQRPLPTSVGAFKSHPLYALRRHLLKFEAIYPDSSIPVGYIRGEPVYARECVHTLHSRENWLKEGRAVRIGEEPYKFVKSRAKWNKPKEDPEAKDLELFGKWQTEVYIPPPAVDGKVPRNAHGNVEMFLPSMLPAGTVHLKIPGLNKVAKKLGIDCAPAMVGWDHHCGFSHPLMDGWIVCEEHKDILLAAWDEEQEIIREKEQQKREKRVYENWRKLIRGLLIKERLKKRFDLEEKPVEDPPKTDEVPATSQADQKSPPEKATDLQHSWPQNRLTSGQHTLCTVEKL